MGVCVVGGINLDVVLRVADLPRAGETVFSLGAARLLGGKGANQAVAVARMGVASRLVGTVGEDAVAGELLALLAREGVDTASVARAPGVATGQAFILVSDDGENLIVVERGANAALRPEDVPAEAIAASRRLLAGFEAPLPAVARALELARAAGVPSLLNAAPALAEGRELLALADVLIVNAGELAAFAGRATRPGALDDIAAAARGLTGRADQVVVVTLGARGAVAVDAAGVIEQPPFPADVVDTTGAGDCFCGVLAAWLSEGADLRQALRAASAAAALSVRTSGAAASMPTRAAVEALLAR